MMRNPLDVVRSIARFRRLALRAARSRLALLKVALRWRFAARLRARKANLDRDLVISLTSHRARFPWLHLTLRCLLTQDVRPDRLVLWVCEQDRAHLPDAVLGLIERGLEIRCAPDRGPYTKLLPTLDAFPDCYIVTADDEMYYAADWLKRLVRRTEPGAPVVVCHRAHRILFDCNNRPLPYGDWDKVVECRETTHDLVATGVGGVLYPPAVAGALRASVAAVVPLAPTADDIGLFWQERLLGFATCTTGHGDGNLPWPGSQQVALFKVNRRENDLSVHRLLGAYGVPAVVLRELAGPEGGSAEADGHAAQWAQGALRRVAQAGLFATLAAQSVTFLAQFATQLVLARLLFPRDFGLVALCTPIAAFVAMIADFGLSQTVIQKPALDADDASFLFWVNLAVAFASMLAICAIAPAAVLFFRKPELGALLCAYGGLLFVRRLSAIPLALLRRRLRFITVAANDVASTLTLSAAALAAAAGGAGYWAILYGQLAASVMSLILAVSAARWRPGPPRRVGGVRAKLGFGANLTGFSVVSYFSRNLDNLLIGRVWGVRELGFYDYSYRLLQLPLGRVARPIGSVALPVLSRLRARRAQYCEAFLKFVEGTAILVFPAMAFALVASQDLVADLLGPRWHAVWPVFSILGLGAFPGLMTHFVGWLFISQGRAREMRRIATVTAAFYVAGFLIGLSWGIEGVAVAYTAVTMGRAPFVWRKATRYGPVRLGHFLSSAAPLLASAAATFAAIYLLHRAFRGPVALAAEFVLAYPVFLCAMSMMRTGRTAVTGTLGSLAQLLMEFGT